MNSPSDRLLDQVLLGNVDGSAYTPERADALIAVEHIVDSLLAGIPSRAMLLMLSSFLSEHAETFVKEQLGCSLLGRPRAEEAERIARDTFTLALECAHPEDVALVLAYDAYFTARARQPPEDDGKPSRPRPRIRAYEADRLVLRERGKNQSDSTLADIRMDEIIRPLLKGLGCQISARKPSGRPSRREAKARK